MTFKTVMPPRRTLRPVYTPTLPVPMVPLPSRSSAHQRRAAAIAYAAALEVLG